MIKLQLKNGDVIISKHKDDNFIDCNCDNVYCNQCPFGTHCGNEFANMTFGKAMQERREQINEMVEYIEDTGDYVDDQEEPKKKYTFELTDEQAMYLHAFMNMWENDAIQDTLDVMEFFDADNPPFIRRDMPKMPKEWFENDVYHIVTIMHELSCEIFNKLSEQREFDE